MTRTVLRWKRGAGAGSKTAGHVAVTNTGAAHEPFAWPDGSEHTRQQKKKKTDVGFMLRSHDLACDMLCVCVSVLHVAHVAVSHSHVALNALACQTVLGVLCFFLNACFNRGCSWDGPGAQAGARLAEGHQHQEFGVGGLPRV